MDNLCNIFKREKNRVGDKYTLFYNQRKNSLQYSNDEGVLTVIFDAKREAENFYYCPNNDKGKGTLGVLVQQNIERGQRAVVAKEIFDICSQNFIDLCADYQFNRDAIGVEMKPQRATGQKRGKMRSSFERD